MAKRNTFSEIFWCLFLLALAVLLEPKDGGEEGYNPQPREDNVRRPPLREWTPRTVRIRQAEPADSVGTMFAVDRSGKWMTAEHVIHGCDRLAVKNGRRYQFIGSAATARGADLAIIRKGLASNGIFTISDSAPQPGDLGFHIGFPHSRAATVKSMLLGHSTALVGRHRKSIAVWAEMERYPEFSHSLSGISGGPTLNLNGNVVGVNSAATDRRGRVFTASTGALQKLASANKINGKNPRKSPSAAAQLSSRNIGPQFDRWRKSGAIRQIYCDVLSDT